MSVAARIVKFFLHLFNAKSYLKNSSARELNKRSLPRPVRGVRRRHKVEKIEIAEGEAYWLSHGLANNGTLVYLHGGAFVLGPVRAQWKYISQLASKMKMAALVINYRQLPDHPFPAGLNDAVDIITQLQQGKQLQEPWYLIGDSAGANLALASCFRIRDLKFRLPSKIILMSPFLDASMSNPAMQTNEHKDPVVSIENMLEKDSYAPSEKQTNPLVSPMFGKLEGLPPLLIQVGTDEVMLWDARKFYLKCLDAGVSVQYHEFEGMFHVFPLLNLLPEAREARKEQVEFLKN